MPNQPEVSSPSPDILAKVSERFKQLTESAATLNTVSDELAKPVGRIETTLHSLNLGIEGWVQTKGGWEDHESGNFERHYIGYAKLDAGWSLAVRVTSGNDNSDEYDSEERWPFNSAPRVLRIEAIDALPELIDRLIKKADSVAKKVTEKTGFAKELADVIVKASIDAKKLKKA